MPTQVSSMVMVSPATSSGFDSTPTIRLTGVVAGESVVVFGNSTCTQELGSATAAGTTVDLTLTALEIGTQGFYTKVSNSIGTTACSGLLLSYTYLGIAPTIATSMTLTSPASSPGTDSTPTFTLGGVVSGETIKIYSSSSCTTELGSAQAAASTVSITTSALAPGIYNFYSRTINDYATSACSGLLASYEYSGVLPNTGNTITLSSPTSSPNYDSTPTFTVGGVANGDTVKLFTDAGCTTLVGSATATTTSVQITTSVLATGVSNFYTLSTTVVGSSACSIALASYNYLGASPTIAVSWNANKEKAVNSAGGGYRVYYSTTSGFNPGTASYVDVPYVAGATAPTTTNLTNFMAGTYYFKIIAYSALNPPGQTGGSTSAASAQFQLTLP